MIFSLLFPITAHAAALNDLSWTGWHVIAPIAWGFAFGFGCGGLHCALIWRRANKKILKDTIEIFERYRR